MKTLLLMAVLAEVLLPAPRPAQAPGTVPPPMVSPAVSPPVQPILPEPKIETRMEPQPVSCFVVKPYVWIYGVEASTAWARRHGYSEGQIHALKKRCWD